MGGRETHASWLSSFSASDTIIDILLENTTFCLPDTIEIGSHQENGKSMQPVCESNHTCKYTDRIKETGESIAAHDQMPHIK